MPLFDGVAEDNARAGHRLLAEIEQGVQEFSRGMRAGNNVPALHWIRSSDYADCARVETVPRSLTLDFGGIFWQKRFFVAT